MIIEPKCSIRKCIYMQGVIQPDGTELSEVACCLAFPMGIPQDIAHGDDKHTEIIEGQVGDYIFTKALE